ncbi:Golgin subfamily A member 4 [Nymphon striatum]|nr:Golgin subfamily A member 4 [Nymphon striatum]
MFRKLKDKIAEEVRQSPIRLPATVQSLGQNVESEETSEFSGKTKSSLHQQLSSATNETDRNALSEAGNKDSSKNLIALAEGSNSVKSTSSVSNSIQFSIDESDDTSGTNDSPAKLLDTSNRETFGKTPTKKEEGMQDAAFLPMYSSPSSFYTLQSDIESCQSEMEDSFNTPNRLKSSTENDQIMQSYMKLRNRLLKYKGKYAEVVKAYKDLHYENNKIKQVLSESQDKALRRISELREQSQLEQKAKVHLEENLNVSLEEKDQLISVLQTQIKLLKEGGSIDSLNDSAILVDLTEDPVKPENSEELTNLREKVKRLEVLLAKCKETIKNHKERNQNLMADKDQISQEFEKKVQELNFCQEQSKKDLDVMNIKLGEMKVRISKMAKREEEESLSMAETKKQMHEELESKEKLISDLKLKEVLLQSEKEEFKRTETALEEEKQTLVQELSRGKAAAIALVKQEEEKKISSLQQEFERKLRTLQQEHEKRIEAFNAQNKENILIKEQEMQVEIKKYENKLNLELHEKEEEMKLAIEERDLQKMAALSQQDSKTDDLNALIESLKTRELELESNIENLKQEMLKERQNWVDQVEKNRARHLNELDENSQKHQSEIEKLKSELEQNFNDKLERILIDHSHEIEMLQKKHDEALQSETTDLETGLQEQIELVKLGHQHSAEENLQNVGNLEDKIKELSQESEEKTQSINILEDKLKEANILEESLKNLVEQEKQAFTKQHEELLEKIESLENMKVNAEKLKSEYEVILQNNEALKCKIDELETKLKNSETEVTKAREEMQQMNSEKHVCEENIQSLNKLDNELKCNYEELQAQFEDIKNKFDITACENKELLSEIEIFRSSSKQKNIDILGELEMSNQENLSLKKAIKEKEIQIGKDAETYKVRLCNTQEEYETKLTKVRNENSEILSSNKNLHEERNSANERVAELDQKALQYIHQIENLKTELVESKSSCESQIQYLNENVSRDLKRMSDDADTLRCELETLKKQLSESENEHKISVEKWEQDLKFKDDALESSLAVIVDKDHEIAELNVHVKTLNEKNEINFKNLDVSHQAKLSNCSQSLKGNLLTLRKDIVVLKENVLNEISNINSFIDGESDSLKIALKSVEARIENESQKCLSSVHDNEILKEKISVLEVNCKDLKEKLSAAEEESSTKMAKHIQKVKENNVLLKQKLKEKLENLKLKYESMLSEANEKFEQQKTNNKIHLEELQENHEVQKNLIRVEFEKKETDLQNILSKFETDLKVTEKKNQGLEEVISKYKSQVLELEQINVMNVNRSEEDMNLKLAFQNQIKSLKNEYDQQLSVMQKSNEHLKIKSEFTDDLQARLHNSEKLLEESNNVHRENIENIEALNKEKNEQLINEHEQALKQLQNEFSIKQEEVARLGDNLNSLTQDISKKSSLIDEFCHCLSIENEGLTDIEFISHVKEVITKLKSLQEDLAVSEKGKDEIINKLKDEIEELKTAETNELSEKSVEYSKLTNERDNLLSQYKMLEEKFSQTEKRLGDMDNKLVEKEKEFFNLKDDHKSLNSKCSELSDQLAKSSDEFTSVNDSLSTTKKHLQESEEKIKSLIEEHKGKLQDLKKKAEIRLAKIKVVKLNFIVHLFPSCFPNILFYENYFNDVLAGTRTLRARCGALEFWKTQFQNQKEKEVQKCQDQIDNLLKQIESKDVDHGKEIAQLNQLVKSAEQKCNDDTEKIRSEFNAVKESLDESLSSNEQLKAEIQNQSEEYDEKLKRSTEQKIKKQHQEQLHALQEEHTVRVDQVEVNHQNKLKVIIKEFTQRIKQKDQEYEEMLTQAINKGSNEENIMIKDHNKEMQELHQDLNEKTKAIEDIRDYYHVLVQDKEKALNEEMQKLKDKISSLETNLVNMQEEKVKEIENFNQKLSIVEEGKKALQTSHSEEIAELEYKYEQDLKRSIENQKSRFTEKITEINHSKQASCTQLESYGDKFKEAAIDQSSDSDFENLEKQSQLAMSVVESGTESAELLRKQIVSQSIEIENLKSKHQNETDEMHMEIERLKSSENNLNNVNTIAHKKSEMAPSSSNLPQLTEIEYLKNILFQYLMGKETMTMIKVISAVLKFSDDQTKRIIEKEEARQSLVSNLYTFH